MERMKIEITNALLCGNQLQIISLQCPSCDTEVKGTYPMGLFSGLFERKRLFALFSILQRFVKEVQERLNISHPPRLS